MLFLAYDHRLVVLRAGVEPAHGVGCTISYHGHPKNHEAMAGLASVLGICAIPCALTAELPKLDMKNGPTIFWLNHSTNIRQYSILIVTVKHGGYFSEVEYVLSFVFCRRGVEFASGEPLADLVAGAVDVHFGEVSCDFDWFSGVFELPEFVVAFGFDGLDSALPSAVWACPCFGLWRAGGLVAAFWAGADDDHGFFWC